MNLTMRMRIKVCQRPRAMNLVRFLRNIPPNRGYLKVGGKRYEAGQMMQRRVKKGRDKGQMEKAKKRDYEEKR